MSAEERPGQVTLRGADLWVVLRALTAEQRRLVRRADTHLLAQAQVDVLVDRLRDAIASSDDPPYPAPSDADLIQERVDEVVRLSGGGAGR